MCPVDLMLQAVMGAAGVGIMASLYGNRVDTGMTLELSMEINKKLQVKPGP